MRAALLVIAIVGSSCSGVLAQPLGHWEKQMVVANARPGDMRFSDALHGLLIVSGSANRVYATSDGGISWNERGHFSGQSRTNVHESSFNEKGNFLFNEQHFSSDFGLTWSDLPAIPTAVAAFWASLVSENDATVVIGQFPYTFDGNGDSVGIYALENGGSDYRRRYAHYIPKTVMEDVLIRDNGHIYLLLDTLAAAPVTIFAISSDGGRSFQHHHFNLQLAFRSRIETTNDTDIYLTSGNSGALHDILYSSDKGESWTERHSLDITDTTKGSRIALLSAPAHDHLWAAVLNTSPLPRAALRDILLGPNFSLIGFADSLFFSSDQGQTWSKDGATFANDTIVEMRWPDPTHGYVATTKNGSTFMYRWVEGSSAVRQIEKQESLLRGSFNSQKITLENLPAGSTIRIYDLLGRQVLPALSARHVPIDVQSLASGCYVVRVEGEVGVFRFVKE